MGEIVNKIAEAAFDWQRPIAWIRINIGYMLVEITDLAKQGDSVTDIEALLSKFNDKFAIFSQAELNVFIAAREAEVDKSLVPNLNTALEVMVKSFSPWLDEFHNLVTKRRKDPPDRALVLLHSCGGEIFNAHKTFVDFVNDYRNRNAIG
jgi:hypothetical protein